MNAAEWMRDDELCHISAMDAIDQFKKHRLSPVEVMEAVIGRAEAINQKINAFTFMYFDRALEQARQAEQRYAQRSQDVRPLEGVPIVIKDLHPVAGERTSFGSKAFADHVPARSAPTVARLLDAGAIMHARSTTPEFGHGPVAKSPLWGVTRNPWNPEFTPGGSSGGAAAAVASGMTVLADGTDGAGSIRNPCSLCGVFGFDPPFGRNPLDISFPRESLVHYGPITRTVNDAILMQNITAGPHPDDPCSLRPALVIPESLEPIKGWRIAFSMDLGYFEVDAEVQNNTREALDVFKSLGCSITEVDVGWTMSVLDAATTLWETILFATAGDLYPRWKYDMDRFVRELIERGSKHSAARLYNTNKVRSEMYRTLCPILDEHDILICPTTALPGLPAEHDILDTSLRINGKPLTYANLPGDAYLQWQMSYPFNLVPECPVASVPSGFAKSGIPTGIQIVGRTYDDVSVFRAAIDYERARAWQRIRPDLTCFIS